MKKKWLLPVMLAITVLVYAGFGAILKYGVLKKLNMDTQESILTLPFVLVSDTALYHTFQETLAAYRSSEAQTVPATEEVRETQAAEATEPPVTSEPTVPDQVPQPTETEPAEPSVPEYIPVSEEWFDDVLFIGDSRIDSLRLSARLGDADYFCATSMTVYDVRFVKTNDLSFRQMNLKTLLTKKTYGKIYIHLGINECGAPLDEFTKNYQRLIDLIKELQPDAYIILQGIMPVTKTYKNAYRLKPERIEPYNECIRNLVTGDNMRYCDTAQWAADESGYLRTDITYDGCHPHGEGAKEWAAWILEDAGWYKIP